MKSAFVTDQINHKRRATFTLFDRLIMPLQVNIHKDLMVRLCGTHDLMSRTGLLLGVVKNHANGKQLTIKKFEPCYSEEQYIQFLTQDFEKRERSKRNIDIQVIGWFSV
jgi:hypothetical protein